METSFCMTNFAEIYEHVLVPTIFEPWSEEIIARARPIGPSDRILDLGCGTGIVARKLREIEVLEQRNAVAEKQQVVHAFLRHGAAHLDAQESPPTIPTLRSMSQSAASTPMPGELWFSPVPMNESL